MLNNTIKFLFLVVLSSCTGITHKLSGVVNYSKSRDGVTEEVRLYQDGKF